MKRYDIMNEYDQDISRAAQALGRRNKGKTRVYDEDERERRRVRLAVLRVKRWKRVEDDDDNI